MKLPSDLLQRKPPEICREAKREDILTTATGHNLLLLNTLPLRLIVRVNIKSGENGSAACRPSEPKAKPLVVRSPRSPKGLAQCRQKSGIPGRKVNSGLIRPIGLSVLEFCGFGGLPETWGTQLQNAPGDSSSPVPAGKVPVRPIFADTDSRST